MFKADVRFQGSRWNKGVETRRVCLSLCLLWLMVVWTELRKTKQVDALRKTKDSPLVVCTVVRVLWVDRAIEKARDWFGRVTATDPDLGDVWAWKFV